VNNLFNLAYEQLAWKIHQALIHAKLEPYLGFLHSTQYGKPSLVCDVQELYRHLVDDFLIQFSQRLTAKDFIIKLESLTSKKRGKRAYLNDSLTREMMNQLNNFFGSYVDVIRIRVGKQQMIETLINEEALLLGKFLRSEIVIWVPKNPIL
jgi:CRISPR-associated protein Cas1